VIYAAWGRRGRAAGWHRGGSADKTVGELALVLNQRGRVYCVRIATFGGFGAHSQPTHRRDPPRFTKGNVRIASLDWRTEQSHLSAQGNALLQPMATLPLGSCWTFWSREEGKRKWCTKIASGKGSTSHSPEHLVPHGLHVPRIFTFDETTEMILDDERGRLTADGDPNPNGTIISFDFGHHRPESCRVDGKSQQVNQQPAPRHTPQVAHTSHITHRVPYRKQHTARPNSMTHRSIQP
jgi:hypothetical protein